MRLCRFSHLGQTQLGIYDEQQIVSLAAAARAYEVATRDMLNLSTSLNLLDFLPPAGPGFAGAKKLANWIAAAGSALPASVRIPTASVQLLVPIPKPNKIFLLAGNYADHIREGGGIAAERAETFPYVFMKPPTTTLTDPGKPVRIPKISPNAIDWELELAVVIGKEVKGISEADALSAVAGYTVINDISNRKFRPNPNRKAREKDGFFDWLHGKWHDSFCPCGPCITSADSIADPQTLEMKLRLNGQIRQDSSTAKQIFPVAAVIEFISGMVTLEPGDIISTGTPSGVGSSSGTFVKPGDTLEASIASIGTLVSPVTAE
jgi:2-keto-4-pentenoate hydratase/2-oxohepta-3-ene-1,7-dioic acid hydratase in catechol pathway